MSPSPLTICGADAPAAEREVDALRQIVTWSQIGDTDSWEPSDGSGPVKFRRGTEFVAGPFDTPEEAQKAINLLMMPVEGNA